MKTLKFIWDNFERWISMFLIAFLTAILFLEVVFRYVFYISIGWIGELSGIFFVWFIYLSISYITGQGGHIRVQILDFITNKEFCKKVDLVMDSLWLAFNALMAYYGFELVMSVVEYPFQTPILDISMIIPYLIIPIAFGLMTIRLGANLFLRFKALGQIEPAEEGS